MIKSILFSFFYFLYLSTSTSLAETASSDSVVDSMKSKNLELSADPSIQIFQNSKQLQPVNQSKETAPPFTYAAWDENGKICILAKFEAVFTITYESSYGTQRLNVKIPQRDVKVNGRCMSLLDDKPILGLSWRGGFTFRVTFGKREATNSWGIDEMDLVYDTRDSAFAEAVNGKQMRARSDFDSLRQFETLLGRSYYCFSPSIIYMYDTDGERNVIARMSNVQLQAHQVEKGKFSTKTRCGLVGFGSGVIAPFYLVSYHEDDSASMVVGVITIFVSLATIAGYAVYRSWFVKKVDYDEMI